MRANTIGGFTMRTPLLRLRDLVSTETALLEAYRIPVVREALYLASPDLYSMLIELEKDAVKDNIRKEKALISLYKYYTRMCTRCTPFGLFAGITAGHLGE